MVLLAIPLAMLGARLRQRAWLDVLVFTPLAVPPLLLGIGLIRTWNHPGLDAVYLGMGVVLIAMVGRYLAFAYLPIGGAIERLDLETQVAGEAKTFRLTVAPLPGEDVQTFEQDLPGQNTVGFNTTTISNLPIEVCMTINDSWGVNDGDENHKSASHLIRTLVRAASVGANYLLNVGPTALGEILPIHAERLRAVGKWLSIHGDSVYGTRAGAILATVSDVAARVGAHTRFMGINAMASSHHGCARSATGMVSSASSTISRSCDSERLAPPCTIPPAMDATHIMTSTTATQSS